MPDISDKDRQRFEKKFIRVESGCWIWTGYRDRKGYGQFWLAGRAYWAHRAAWMIYVGAIPEGFEIDHKQCLNESCVNPACMEPVPSTVNRSRQNPT